MEQFGDPNSNPLSWPTATIGEICDIKSGTTLPAAKENEGGEIAYIKVADMNIPGNENISQPLRSLYLPLLLGMVFFQ